MPSVSNIRGALFEEVLLFLLEKNGYTILEPGAPGTIDRNDAVFVQGRGHQHQIDALAEPAYTPNFMYPLRLIVEAKCYTTNDANGRRGKSIGLNIGRSMVGLLKDINENYFSYQPNDPHADEVQVRRYNYLGALFSVGGFSDPLQHYAIAHQVALIEYHGDGLVGQVVDRILSLEETNIPREIMRAPIQRIRHYFRRLIRGERYEYRQAAVPQQERFALLCAPIVESAQTIQTSLVGMVGGKWPVHLVSDMPFPGELLNTVVHGGEIHCQIYFDQDGRCFFMPSETAGDFPRNYDRDRANIDNLNIFKLEFSLPDEVLKFLVDSPDAERRLERKQHFLSRIEVQGTFAGVQRRLQLVLDPDWYEGLLGRARERNRD